MSEDVPGWVPADLNQLYRRLSPDECTDLERVYASSDASPAPDAVYAVFAGRFNDHLPLVFADVRRGLSDALARDELSRAMSEVWRLPLLVEKAIHDIIAELPTVPKPDREVPTLESE